MRSLAFFTLPFLLSTSLSVNGLDAETVVESPEKKFSLAQVDCQFSGTFSQVKQLANIDNGLSSKGVFYHHCQKGVIWSTLEPLLETLVMRRDGNGFIVNETGSKQLKSRQGKFLSDLLNDLMSGDQAGIETQFVLTTDNDNLISLKPKKRSLKRAIKLIQVQRSLMGKTVNILIIDRNDQKTRINSIQTRAFDNDNMLENCRIATDAVPHNAALISSCELLLQNNDSQ